MPQDSVQQAIARGALGRLRQSPQRLSTLEIRQISDCLEWLSHALDSGTALPGPEPHEIAYSIDEVRTRMLVALLDEFVRYPAEPNGR